MNATGSSAAADRLVALSNATDPFIHGPKEIGSLQMQAIRELLDRKSVV